MRFLISLLMMIVLAVMAIIITVAVLPSDANSMSVAVYAIFMFVFVTAAFVAIIQISLLAYSLIATLRLIRRLNQHPELLTQQITDEDTEIDNPIARQFAQVTEQLGFEPFGIVRNALFTEYVYINDDHTIVAPIRPRSEKVAQLYLGTMFDDEFFLETGFNGSLNLTSAGLHLRSVAESIPAAYNYHMQQLARLRVGHRTPVPLTTIGDYIERGVVYRSRHMALENRMYIQGMVQRLVIAAAIAVVNLGGIGLIARQTNGLVLCIIILFSLTLFKVRIPEFETVAPRKKAN